MNELFLYNPENDIALAVNPTGSFTPPRQAALLAHYGAPLMWWMGEPGDHVLLPTSLSAADADRIDIWRDVVTARFGNGPDFIQTCSGINLQKLSPWGWSRATMERLARSGVDGSLLGKIPVDTLRQLSHRRTAGLINAAIRSTLGSAWGAYLYAEPAFEARSINEAVGYISASGATEHYIKAPWSSSGRGVVCSSSLTPAQIISRCDGVIRHQGSVLIERGYRKIVDFAMLFEADGTDAVRFAGMSSFFNGRDVSYTGNIVTSDNAIIAGLCRYVPEEMLEDLIKTLPIVLTDILKGAYCGCFGIDMMVVESRNSSSGYAIVPCVELNLRMTMGVVAHRLFRRLGCKGIMKVHPVADKAAGHPDDTLPLVPLNDYFNIRFYYSGTSTSSGSVAGI